MSIVVREAGSRAEEASQSAPSSNFRRLVPCTHCGEMTPSSLQSESQDVFCCSGCAGAYQLIQGLGLDDFYSLRENSKATGQSIRASQQSRYEQYEDPEFLGPSVPEELSDGSHRSVLHVQGIHCAACSWLIENAAVQEPGILSARVRLVDHSVEFHYDPKQTTLGRIAKYVDALGYRLSPRQEDGNSQVRSENRRLLVQIAIAGFLAANAMWIAIALYAGAQASTRYGYFLGLIGMALGGAAVLGPGRTFFVGAMTALRTKTPHMDLPVALGLSIGSLAGTYNAVLGHGHVYFDSLATLVFLLLIGRWIQFRQQNRAAQAIDLMMRLTPREATKVEETGKRLVLADSLREGDRIEVLSGDSIPADGRLISRASAVNPKQDAIGKSTVQVDNSLLTGESLPVEIHEGQAVAAGAINLGPPILVEVEAVGAKSRAGKLMRLVESAAVARTPIIQFADRIGGYFVAVVTVLAILAFVLWWPKGLDIATGNATALLIVACPCALALAAPLAIAVSLGRAAAGGILVRDGSILQTLAKPGMLWFDKTGTLTEGKQQITSMHLLGNTKEHEAVDEYLELAASLEACSSHPVAVAIVTEAKLRNLNLAKQVNLDASERNGVQGTVEHRQVAVGNLLFLKTLGCKLDTVDQLQVDRMALRGESPVLVAIDGRAKLLLGLSDPIRAEAKGIVASLQDTGWKIGILSGDHPAIVERVGKELGLNANVCSGGKSPEQKMSQVEASKASGATVAMIGDGANDAVALAAADVGIALRGGAEVSLQAAPVFVARSGLGALRELFVASKRVERLIWTTFTISLLYNLLAVAVALTGNLSPLLAAILMPLSSASVLAFTLGYPTFRRHLS